jgi:trans-aconitate methyltransferase
MSEAAKVWDAAAYQSRFSFVFKHGEGVVELLDPKRGERILDLGCGSGQLTARIAEAGAMVEGIDQSPDMIAQARKNYPAIDFRVADATSFAVDTPVEAVFSNAVLHWVKNASAAIDCIHRALQPGGRFVMEMGGKGNTKALLGAVQQVAGELDLPWFYPTIGEYAALLEHAGFEVRYATLFDRPTMVEGENGLDDWLVMFGGRMFSNINEERKREIRLKVADKLRPVFFRDGNWTLDYRRLRVVAVRV